MEGKCLYGDVNRAQPDGYAPGTPFNEVLSQEFLREAAGEIEATSVATEIKLDGLSVEFIVRLRAKP